MYLNGFDINNTIKLIKNLEKLSNERNVHTLIAIRHDLLSNEYMLHVPRVLAVHPDTEGTGNEEQFSRMSKSYPVSFMYKAGSSKLEVEDRLHYSLREGFAFKIDSKLQAIQSSNDFGEMSPSSEAIILVEDSDRDSEGEMEADADF